MHPIFIVAAAVVGLPVLLHLLLRQQPKRLIFPALRFLKLRQKSSQRKVQLRHIILMALRVLLLALFAAALYQPTVASFGSASLTGGPVAAVLILDTSPSMGYKEGTTRLDDARRRAADFLNELPPNSVVAVLSTHEPNGEFQATVPEARQQIDALKEPSGSAKSLSEALRRAYTLFQSEKANPDGADPLPRVVAVFGDRAQACWSAADTPSLIAQRDRVPQPAPVHVFFDVGTEKPVNLAVTDLRMDSDRLPASADAVVTAFVRADGLDVGDLEVKATLDNGDPQAQLVKLAAGTTAPVRFTFKAITPGFHTVSVKLGRDDALPADNERTFTFEVQPRRAILAITDKPDDVSLWRESHNSGPREFGCTVATPDKLPPLAEFEMVAVIAVVDPSKLKESLEKYVAAGGKLLLAPDGPGSTDARKTDYAKLGELMPCQLGDLKTLTDKADDNKRFGVPWKVNDDNDLRHRLFAPAREWDRSVDFFADPKKVEQFRALIDPPKGSVVVYYDDSNDPKARTPAVAEKTYGKGKVLLLTTRIDNAAGSEADYWNGYWKSGHSWPIIFPWLVTKYLTDPEVPVQAVAGTKRAYNFATADDLELSVPLAGFASDGRKVRLEGPGVLAERSRYPVPSDVGTLTIKHKPVPPPVQLIDGKEVPVPPPPGEWWAEGTPFRTAGAFAVKPDGSESPWQFRFSLATPSAESDLTKVPTESVAELFGPDRIVNAEGKVSIVDLIQSKFAPPFELFYPLILLVLIFFAFEAIMANRFYRLKS